jgi:hypothetical protein
MSRDFGHGLSMVFWVTEIWENITRSRHPLHSPSTPLPFDTYPPWDNDDLTGFMGSPSVTNTES